MPVCPECWCMLVWWQGIASLVGRGPPSIPAADSRYLAGRVLKDSKRASSAPFRGVPLILLTLVPLHNPGPVQSSSCVLAKPQCSSVAEVQSYLCLY